MDGFSFYRLVSLAHTKSPIEREWFSAREREKGNDLYKVSQGCIELLIVLEACDARLVTHV